MLCKINHPYNLSSLISETKDYIGSYYGIINPNKYIKQQDYLTFSYYFLNFVKEEIYLFAYIIGKLESNLKEDINLNKTMTDLFIYLTEKNKYNKNEKTIILLISVEDKIILIKSGSEIKKKLNNTICDLIIKDNYLLLFENKLFRCFIQILSDINYYIHNSYIKKNNTSNEPKIIDNNKEMNNNTSFNKDRYLFIIIIFLLILLFIILIVLFIKLLRQSKNSNSINFSLYNNI